MSLKYDSIKCEEIYTRRAILYNCTLSYINTKIKSDVCLYKSINNIKDKVNIIPIYLDILIESSRQGGFTYAGSKYEDLIYEHLHNIGITEEDNELLRFEHEENAKTLEHDFTFVYKDIRFGISAKKTLRERYKQYVNPLGNTETQIPLCICLGTDLNEDKAKNITNLNTHIFVSPEIYNERDFLQKMDKVYSIEDFTTNILDLIIHKYKITSNYNMIKTVLGSVEDIESEIDECECFLLEEQKNEYKIELESKYVYIPTLGIKIHSGYCDTYNDDTNEYELDYDTNIVFDINTNEQVYEEPQSDLIGCISNYINLRNKPVDDILGLECQVIY